MRQRLVVALLVFVAAGCGGSASSDPFAYDDGQPLDVQRGSEVPANDQVVVQELTYASGDDRVEGYLVVPRTRSGQLPAVVFLHGAGGDREEQLGPAVELAERGAVALTITAPSRAKSPPADASPKEALLWQRDTVVADVVAARRAFDVLTADDRVDGDRLGLAGWSMGARLATIVADVDERTKATVLMSGGALPVSEYVDAAPVEFRDEVQDVLPAVDPLTHVRNVKGALFVQAGAVRFDRPAASSPRDGRCRARRHSGRRGTRRTTAWTTRRCSTGSTGCPSSLESAASRPARATRGAAGTGDGKEEEHAEHRAGGADPERGRRPIQAPAALRQGSRAHGCRSSTKVYAPETRDRSRCGITAAKIAPAAMSSSITPRPEPNSAAKRQARTTSYGPCASGTSRIGAGNRRTRGRTSADTDEPRHGAATTEPTDRRTAPAPSTSPAVPGERSSDFVA